MRNLFKEIALYLLVATVMLNLTVNIVQNKTEDTLIKIVIEQTGYIREVDGILDEIINILDIQERLLTNYYINLVQLNKLTKTQREPDFERLLTATVQISNMGREGTGICINEDSDYYYILTAQHVVAARMGNVVSVRTRDKLIYAGEIIKEDTNVDLALLKVKKWTDVSLTTVKLSNNEPKIKDRVFIVGHPLGISWTLVEGVVSNLNNKTFIMTTAPTTFGNSGGALFNTDGDIIGIIAKVYGYLDGVPESSMGLAIRLSLIKEFLEVK